MKITFIRPNLTDTRSSDAWKPLVFAILAGLTPPDVDLDFFDEHLEPIPQEHDTDLVALTVGTYTAKRAYQIASQYRKRGVPVVMGGYHPSFLPDEALTYSDAVVIGDAEGVWQQLVEDARRHKLQRVYRMSKQPSLEGLKFDYSIFNGKRYKSFIPIQFGRGCQYACDYCAGHAFYGSHTRQRPVNEVVAEIKALNHKNIIFIDDNLFADVSKTEELLQALIPLKIHWGSAVTLDIVNNTRLLDLMVRSGCLAVTIGFESLNQKILQQMNKGWNLRHGDFSTIIQKLHDRGIMVLPTFLFGYDHDTIDAFDITVEFAIRSKVAQASFFTLTPMPGSKLYSRLKSENRLIYKRWWLHPNYRFGQATFYPQGMEPAELSERCRRARNIFYSYRSIIQRAFDTAANSRNIRNLGFTLALNLIVKHNLTSNIGRQLGAKAILEPQLENVPLEAI
jgi:radical SAM superfamily enzyme YgiQ (UPF0313 family)